MTQKTFLRRLRMWLWLREPPNDRDSILEDYEEYFTNGLAEGKTEQELCKRFGRPAQIVRELARMGGRRFPLASYGVLSLLLLALLIFLLPLFIKGYYFFDLYNFMPWLLFGLSLGSMAAARRQSGAAVHKRFTVFCTTGTAVLAAEVVAVSIALANLWEIVQWWIAGRNDLNQLGPLFSSSALLIPIILLILLWMVEASFPHKLPRWTLALYPVNAMLLSVLWEYIKIMHQMDDPDILHRAILYAVTQSMLQLLLVLPALWLAGRKEQVWTHR